MVSLSPFRLGLIQCGHINPDLAQLHGDYPHLFGSLLGSLAATLEVFDVQVQEPPPVDSCDGWLVSGSPDSTYDPLPWIPPVEDFLRAVVGAQAPLVAICFGHQLLAQALGGQVARAPEGWGVGVHRYELTGPVPSWMDSPPPSCSVRLVASHQDQVVRLPAGAEVVARTEHCRAAAYTLGPSALAIQPHPEFTAGLSEALIRVRRERIGADTADAALGSLTQPLDSDLVARWMVAFLRQGQRREPSTTP